MNLFLSHATSDADLVGDVRARMQAIGVSVYTAEHDRRAGDDVHAKIGKAIEACHVMVVLQTKAGYVSNYLHEEVGYAVGIGKTVVPLVTAEAVRSGLSMLEGIEYITVDEANRSEALHRLSERIDHLARAKQNRDDMILAALLMVSVGVIIIAMRESA